MLIIFQQAARAETVSAATFKIVQLASGRVVIWAGWTSRASVPPNAVPDATATWEPEMWKRLSAGSQASSSPAKDRVRN